MVTEGGDLLGTIAAVDVDEEVHTVTAYTLAASLVERLHHHEPTIAASEVPRLGDDGIMLVSGAVGARLQKGQE